MLTRSCRLLVDSLAVIQTTHPAGSSTPSLPSISTSVPLPLLSFPSAAATSFRAYLDLTRVTETAEQLYARQELWEDEDTAAAAAAMAGESTSATAASHGVTTELYSTSRASFQPVVVTEEARAQSRFRNLAGPADGSRTHLFRHITEESESAINDEETGGEAPANTDGSTTGVSAAAQAARIATKKNLWASTEKLDVSNFHEQLPNMAIRYPFELDTFQKEAILHLEKNESVLVAAHTSAGVSGQQTARCGNLDWTRALTVDLFVVRSENRGRRVRDRARR
jgi:hypothetical protein